MPDHLRIAVTDVAISNWIIIAVLVLWMLASIRRSASHEILSTGVGQELKGLGMLAVLFGHIGYFLVNDYEFLYLLSIISGLGVDIFLFLSGYGLTVGMLKKSMPVLDFYKR